jgi:hypothetical protein
LPKDTNIVVAEVDGTSIIIKQKEENSIWKIYCLHQAQ